MLLVIVTKIVITVGNKESSVIFYRHAVKYWEKNISFLLVS